MRLERSGSVVKHLQLKDNYLRDADARHRAIRPVIVALSGVFRGVHGGGCLTALFKAGFGETFDHAVAVSTGAPGLGYFLGGNPEMGQSIYWEECLSGKFIPMHFLDGAKALLSQWGLKRFGDHHLMDIEYLCRVFRGLEGNKPMNIEALKASRTSCQVVVVRCHDGEGVLLDVKKLKDPIEGIRAAIAIPGVSNGRVAIDGVLYEDGVGAMPCDLELIIRELEPTDILVLANRPEGDHSHAVEHMLTQLATKDECVKIREDFATREERFDKGINFLRNWDGRWGIIWPDAEEIVSTIETDQHKLRDAAKASEAWMTRLIDDEMN